MRTFTRYLIPLSLAAALTGVMAAQAGDDVGPLDADLPIVASSSEGTNASCATGNTGWDHCRDVWQSGSTTYCYLKAKQFWVRSTNDVSETAMIACAASTTKLSSSSLYSHYCQFNVTSCESGYGDWSYMRLWEY